MDSSTTVTDTGRSAAAQAGPLTKYRWLICALLFVATTIIYIDRQILALVKPILDKEWGWSYKEYALITSLFQGAYAVGLLGFGWFIDRYGTKIGYAVSIGLWGVAAMCHGLVGSVAGFRWVRIFVGVSEAGNFPCAIKAVAHWFPRKERAFATTLFNSGANIGPVVAPAIIPAIALAWGWRAPFIMAGLAGIVWVVVWMWIFSNDPSQHASVGAGELAHIKSDRDEAGSSTTKVRWRVLLQYRETWSFVAAKFLTDPVWWFFLYFLPDYFHTTKGLDIKKLGPPIIVLYLIVSVFSIMGGWLTNYLIQKGWGASKARKVCMLLFAFGVVPIVFVKFCGLWGAVCLIGLAGAAHQAWSANLFTTVSDMFPKRAVASTVGLGGMAGSIGGLLFPLMSGSLLDAFKAKGDINLGYGILFAICAGAYLVAFGVSHLLAPRFEMVQMNEDGTKAGGAQAG